MEFHACRSSWESQLVEVQGEEALALRQGRHRGGIPVRRLRGRGIVPGLGRNGAGGRIILRRLTPIGPRFLRVQRLPIPRCGVGRLHGGSFLRAAVRRARGCGRVHRHHLLGLSIAVPRQVGDIAGHSIARFPKLRGRAAIGRAHVLGQFPRWGGGFLPGLLHRHGGSLLGFLCGIDFLFRHTDFLQKFIFYGPLEP